MKSGWKKVRLGEVCASVCSGGTPKSTIGSYYDGGQIPWLNTKEIDFSDVWQIEKCITESGLNNSAAKWIPANSIAVAMYGATAGKSAIVRVPYTSNQACCNLTISENLAEIRYVYYSLKLQYKFLSSLANGGAQQNLNAELIKNFELDLPPLATQQKIAAVLGALDDKIENNRKLCKKLEETAQALFKSWFVDFEPWGGKMPEGWKMGTLGDVAEITMGQSPEGCDINAIGEGVTFYQGRTEFGFVFPSQRLSTTAPKRMASAGDVLLSVRAPVGDVNIALDNCCIGRGIASIHPLKIGIGYAWCLLKSLKSEFDVYDGAGTVFGSINKNQLNALGLVIPSEKAILDFGNMIDVAFGFMKELELESRKLAEIRDALLPKLMSGELEVA